MCCFASLYAHYYTCGDIFLCCFFYTNILNHLINIFFKPCRFLPCILFTKTTDPLIPLAVSQPMARDCIFWTVATSMMLPLTLTGLVAPPSAIYYWRIPNASTYAFISLVGERCQQRGRVSGRAAVPSLCEPDEVGPEARHVAPRWTQAAVVWQAAHDGGELMRRLGVTPHSLSVLHSFVLSVLWDANFAKVCGLSYINVNRDIALCHNLNQCIFPEGFLDNGEIFLQPWFSSTLFSFCLSFTVFCERFWPLWLFKPRLQ